MGPVFYSAFCSFSVTLKIALEQLFDLDLVVSKKEGIIYDQRGPDFYHYRLMHVLEHSPLRYPEYNLLDPLWIVNF